MQKFGPAPDTFIASNANSPFSFWAFALNQVRGGAGRARDERHSTIAARHIDGYAFAKLSQIKQSGNVLLRADS
jgi:hypothetical protein